MIDPTPILTADPAVRIHVFAALAAVALTPLVLLRRRRDRLHKRAGYAWIASIVIAAAASFWINEIRLAGPFSPIHALSIVALVNVALAIRAVRRGNLARHRAILRQTVFWSLGVAGGFTFLPGRRMHAVLFGPQSAADGTDLATVAAIGVTLAAIAAIAWRAPRAGAVRGG
ncbi:MAG: DUF2306 domain-containing protein [Maritimibacter sp.]|nr:DUF2306 domain-containing protein [Maritimibacter sp.]